MKLRIPLAFFALALFSLPGHAQPFISGFSPPLGSYSDLTPVEIDGSGFSGGTLVVKFNNTLARSAFAGTDGLIQAFIATNTPLGPGPIFVSVNGNSTQSGNSFLVISPGPVVTNFFPTVGAPGTEVTIQGVHFVNGSGSRSVTNVSFNGITAGITSLADDQITANVPAGVTTGPIIVRSSLGAFSTLTNTLSTATNFFVPPVITGFSPSFGRTGTNVVLTGSNFLCATSVTFNNVAASFTPPTNNATLRAVVPPGATTGTIKVNTPANNPFTTSSNFVVQPTVFGFTPGFGPVGTSVTVSGANFNVGTPSVKFGNVTAATPTGVSFGQLTAIVPAGATNGPITVTTTDGSSTSTQIFYLPPGISGFTPANSPPGTTLQVTGTNFTGATAVTFAGTLPVAPTVVNNTTLSVTVPAGVITGPISVTTPGGTADSGTLLFYGSPIINSFSPTHGLPNTNVILLGTNFLGATGIKFGAVSTLTFSVVNNGQINTVVPNGAQTGKIMVLAPGGTNTSAGIFGIDATDLGVSLGDAPDPVFVGSNLVYTITIANSSAFDATNAKLTNTLPALVRLVSATTTQGSLNTNANPILGTLGTIGAGGSATVTLTVVPLAPGSITDNASAGSDVPDAFLANNTGSISTTVWPLPLLSIAPLTNQVQVFWPAPLSNFTLQYLPALSPAYGWSNLVVVPVISGSNCVVTDPSTNPSRFYRLKH